MTGNAFAPTSLLELLGKWSDLPESITFYLFGSWLRDSPSANDVDILLVYPDGNIDQAHIVAQSIRNAAAEATYDVLALSTTEERELGFLVSERAVRIWPPASQA